MEDKLLPCVDPIDPMCEIIHRWMAEREKNAREARARLVEICKHLAQAGIVQVDLEFDGYGDSGQFESIRASDAKGDVELADISLPPEPTNTTSTSLSDTLENICFNLLESVHGGWENNDGAYGTFSIDVPNATASLDYNERFVDTRHSGHDFIGEA